MFNAAKSPYLSILLFGLLLGSCVPMYQSAFLASYQRDINSATRSIEAARDDAHRAAAYTKRGEAYSEKARYSRAFKLIPSDEYARLFALAIKDHDQAIALDPSSAGAYCSRGQAYYDRAVLEVVVNGMRVGDKATWEGWFAPAIADFRTATVKDARRDEAWDKIGLSYETMGEFDEAIDAYTHEKALNRLGKARLADAYCERGGADQKEKKRAAAIADYEESIVNGASADGCSCDPYNPLVALYADDLQYDQGWKAVHTALAARKWIAPELLERLVRESGRKN